MAYILPAAPSSRYNLYRLNTNVSQNTTQKRCTRDPVKRCLKKYLRALLVL